MPMSDVIADVLKDSEPMRPAELVVALQDLGCRAEDDPRKVLRTVRKALQGNPRRFQNDGGGHRIPASQSVTSRSRQAPNVQGTGPMFHTGLPSQKERRLLITKQSPARARAEVVGSGLP